MSVLVQKFGGTSVADAGRIRAAASRAIEAQKAGDQVVMVVSARGHTTDELIDLARQVNPHPPARELDMLLSTGEQVSVALMAMAILAQGVPAISFTGVQIGIVTDSYHTKARIRNISTDRMVQALLDGQIVIVAGFQGVDEHYNITTLGRGGSDTTAVALAAVLGARACEIYTDVDGVYTTDPRLVPEARRVDRISYDEMLELASLGAGVMHSRSIEFAKKFGVPIHVRSSFDQREGTWIVGDSDARHLGVTVSGAALAKEEARVTVLGVPDRPGLVHALFGKIAAANIVVDMIVQNIASDGLAEVSFTVPASDLRETLSVARDAAHSIGAQGGVTHDPNVAKVSVVGLGMRTHVGVAAKMFSALAEAGINIQMITTSEIKISVLVSKGEGPEALRAVHQVFELNRPPEDGSSPFSPSRLASDTPDLANSVEASSPTTVQGAGMEDLVVSGVELDEEQALVTIWNVPDQPGYAAKVFDWIARSGINVDMIVQNVSHAGLTNLSFTIPKRQASQAEQAVRQIGLGKVHVDPSFAKLSVLGIGMRSHTGVANRMFGALAEKAINIAMINTSEVRINVATELAQGEIGLNCLRRAFDLA